MIVFGKVAQVCGLQFVVQPGTVIRAGGGFRVLEFDEDPGIVVQTPRGEVTLKRTIRLPLREEKDWKLLPHDADATGVP